MSLCQREKSMVKTTATPSKRIYMMTAVAILAESRLRMVRLSRRHIFVPVTVHTIHARNIKPEGILRFMAFNAICSPVRAKKRETAELVNFSKVLYQP